MTDWTAGYVSDIEYTMGFYREQSPAHLDLACLIGGVEPPREGTSFTYCELGCGIGYTALVLAAANPKGEFHAADFNPAHIARARAMAAGAGITNITFYEASFDEMADGALPGLPDFDYVTAHGVYSWISPENRAHIVRFLNRKLKPGGVAYLSYNAMPSWAPVQPVQRLLYEVAHLAEERSDLRVGRAIDVAQRMFDLGAPALTRLDAMKHLQEGVKTGNMTYLAHEYLNGSWQPLYHLDVARELAAAKLSYVASGRIVENYPGLCASPEQNEFLASIPVPEVRETLRDYFTPRSLRKDLFVRGARRLDPERRRVLLERSGVAMVIPAHTARLAVDVPLGEAELEERLYRPVFAALGEGPQTLGDLLARPEIAAVRGKADAVELAGMLVGSVQAVPVSIPEMEAGFSGPADSVLRLNRYVCKNMNVGERKGLLTLATTRGGTGVGAGPIELFLLDGILNGVPAELAPMVDHGWSRMQATGTILSHKGQPVQGEEANRAALAEALPSAIDNLLPVWRQLGVC